MHLFFFFLIVTFKAFFLFLICSNFTTVWKGLIFFVFILNGIAYASWRCDLISFIHFRKFLDISFMNINISHLLLLCFWWFFLSYILLQHPMYLGFSFFFSFSFHPLCPLLLPPLPPSFPSSSFILLPLFFLFFSVFPSPVQQSALQFSSIFLK